MNEFEQDDLQSHFPAEIQDELEKNAQDEFTLLARLILYQADLGDIPDPIVQEEETEEEVSYSEASDLDFSELSQADALRPVLDVQPHREHAQTVEFDLLEVAIVVQRIGSTTVYFSQLAPGLKALVAEYYTRRIDSETLPEIWNAVHPHNQQKILSQQVAKYKSDAWIQDGMSKLMESELRPPSKVLNTSDNIEKWARFLFDVRQKQDQFHGLNADVDLFQFNSDKELFFQKLNDNETGTVGWFRQLSLPRFVVQREGDLSKLMILKIPYLVRAASFTFLANIRQSKGGWPITDPDERKTFFQALQAKVEQLFIENEGAMTSPELDVDEREEIQAEEHIALSEDKQHLFGRLPKKPKLSGQQHAMLMSALLDGVVRDESLLFVDKPTFIQAWLGKAIDLFEKSNIALSVEGNQFFIHKENLAFLISKMLIDLDDTVDEAIGIDSQSFISLHNRFSHTDFQIDIDSLLSMSHRALTVIAITILPFHLMYIRSATTRQRLNKKFMISLQKKVAEEYDRRLVLLESDEVDDEAQVEAVDAIEDAATVEEKSTFESLSEPIQSALIRYYASEEPKEPTWEQVQQYWDGLSQTDQALDIVEATKFLQDEAARAARTQELMKTAAEQGLPPKPTSIEDEDTSYQRWSEYLLQVIEVSVAQTGINLQVLAEMINERDPAVIDGYLEPDDNAEFNAYSLDRYKHQQKQFERTTVQIVAVRLATTVFLKVMAVDALPSWTSATIDQKRHFVQFLQLHIAGVISEVELESQAELWQGFGRTNLGLVMDAKTGKAMLSQQMLQMMTDPGLLFVPSESHVRNVVDKVIDLFSASNKLSGTEGDLILLVPEALKRSVTLYLRSFNPEIVHVPAIEQVAMDRLGYYNRFSHQKFQIDPDKLEDMEHKNLTVAVLSMIAVNLMLRADEHDKKHQTGARRLPSSNRVIRKFVGQVQEALEVEYDNRLAELRQTVAETNDSGKSAPENGQMDK